MKPSNLDPNDPTVRSAVFGQQVQDFLRSEVGDFLLKRAESRLAVLVQGLKTIDATKILEVTNIQAEIRHLEGFEHWLADAVQEGLTAQAIIDGEDIDA